MFSLYALLGPESPEMSIDSLAAELRVLFKDERNFSLEFERIPFAKEPTLALRWGEAWFTRVCYEQGERAARDVPAGLSGISRRIRVVFGDDDARDYTNQIIDLMEYLRAIKGVVVFDPQRNDIVS